MNSNLLPPAARTSAGLQLNDISPGELRLQVCKACGEVQYPPRDLCGDCLADCLEIKTVSGAGTVVASSVLHHSLDAYFQQRLPWQLASVQLDTGPVVLVMLSEGDNQPGKRVMVCQVADAGGQWVLIAAGLDVELQNENVRREITGALDLVDRK